MLETDEAKFQPLEDLSLLLSLRIDRAGLDRSQHWANMVLEDGHIPFHPHVEARRPDQPWRPSFRKPVHPDVEPHACLRLFWQVIDDIQHGLGEVGYLDSDGIRLFNRLRFELRLASREPTVAARLRAACALHERALGISPGLSADARDKAIRAICRGLCDEHDANDRDREQRASKRAARRAPALPPGALARD